MAKTKRKKKRKSDKRQWILPTCSWIVLAVVIGLWVLQDGLGERHWLSTFLAYVPQLPFLILPVAILLISLLKLRFLAVIPAAMACLIVVFLNMRYQLRLAPAEARSPNSLTVLTWNIKGGEGGLDALVALIERTGADVVCLQEYTGNFGGKPAEQEWRASLPDEYEFIRQDELVTLVRSTPLRARSVNLRDTASGGYRRNALEVSVNHQGRRVSILNVHLTTSITGESILKRMDSVPAYLEQATKVRSEQFSNIIQWQKLADGLTIVAGDFNTPPRGRLYRRMTTHSRDSFAAAGRGFGYTYRADIPVLRIDYVFAGGGLEVESCQVIKTRASDHLPVLSVLRASR